MSILAIGLGILGIGGAGAAVAFIPGASAVAGRAVAVVLAFLAKMPPVAFAIIALILFALWQVHVKNIAEAKIPALERKAENSHQAFLLEKQAFAAEKASLDGARAAIERQNQAIAAQGAELGKMEREAATADTKNARLAQSTDAQIAALRLAATKHTAPCTLSDEAKRELENQ